MKVLELKGIPSFYATQAFHKLMLGLKMLPAYFNRSYFEFYSEIDLLPPEEQEKYIREAALFVKLETDEQLDLLQFCADANGIPYGAQNVKSLEPAQIHEIMVAVCVEIAKCHKVRLVSESEKKKSEITA